MMKKFTTQIVAYSKDIEVIAETADQAKEITHAEHSLQDTGICDTKVIILTEEELCQHIRVRFITEEIKKVPEGYSEMQERMSREDDYDKEDLKREGYFVNKEICADCGKVLFTDEQ